MQNVLYFIHFNFSVCVVVFFFTKKKNENNKNYTYEAISLLLLTFHCIRYVITFLRFCFAALVFGFACTNVIVPLP